MAKGEIEADLEKIDETKLLFLIQQVFDCLQNEKGESPFCTIMGSNVMLFEFEDLRYRIEIKNINQFQ